MKTILDNETAPKRISFSGYWTEALGEEIKRRSTEDYPIELHRSSEAFDSLTKAIEQGIDSYLEAIQFKQGSGDCGRARFNITPKTLHVLVRRLLESGEENDHSLASGICETLNIELV